MLTPQQRNAVGHFRTKPDLLTISIKVEDWFEASYHDRQESLMTDHEITGLVVVTDGYVTVLEGPKVSRGARNNRILSACSGTPAQFIVYSSKALDLCREFVGFGHYDDHGNLPHPLPAGPSVHAESLKLNDPEMLTKHFRRRFNKDGKLHIKLFTLHPPCLPTAHVYGLCHRGVAL
jgi:hypothetical protein